jgi:hypothetical protein
LEFYFSTVSDIPARSLRDLGMEDLTQIIAGQVALEAGKSAAIVMKHYFDIVEARTAKEYWDIGPLPRGDRKIVALG